MTKLKFGHTCKDKKVDKPKQKGTFHGFFKKIPELCKISKNT